jgi:hypothetical protein
MISRAFCVFLVGILSFAADAQTPKKYNLFQLEDNDVIWRNTYPFTGAPEDLRPLVVQMLKSKFFTFNVVRNEAGYVGEIQHYKVDCKRYGRSYLNTPRMYWDGEWTGKFVVRVFPDRYEVMIYALYAEKIEQNVGYYKGEKTVSGRYVDIVTKKGKGFKKNEYGNMDLLSLSLKDSFDISAKTSDP